MPKMNFLLSNSSGAYPLSHGVPCFTMEPSAVVVAVGRSPDTCNVDPLCGAFAVFHFNDVFTLIRDFEAKVGILQEWGVSADSITIICPDSTDPLVQKTKEFLHTKQSIMPKAKLENLLIKTVEPNKEYTLNFDENQTIAVSEYFTVDQRKSRSSVSSKDKSPGLLMGIYGLLSSVMLVGAHKGTPSPQQQQVTDSVAKKAQ